jgi:hypothetical protein
MRRIEQQASKVKEKYSYGIMFEIFAKWVDCSYFTTIKTESYMRKKKEKYSW